MAGPNPNNYQLQGFESYWSIDTMKSIIDNPSQISYRLANTPSDHSLEFDFTIKFLQDVYNPPDHNLNLSQQKIQELHYMRVKERRPSAPFSKEMPKKIDMPWDGGQEQPPIVRVINKNSRPPAMKVFNRSLSGMMDTFNSNKRPLPFPYTQYPQYPMRPPEKPQKGKIDMNNSYYDLNPKKKIHVNRETAGKNSSQNVKVIDIDDDDDVMPVQPIKKNKNEKRLLSKGLSRTGLNKTKSFKMIEISDSPESDEMIKNDIPGEERANEEEKDGDRETTTNATNMTNMDELNENEKDAANGNMKGEEIVDFFNFDSEDFGIKILGEVFLCNKCQKQIVQKDVDKGFKDTCPSCLKAKNSKSTGNRKNQSINIKEEIVKPEINTISNNTSNHVDANKDMFNILGPIYQGRFHYEESAHVNILDPVQNKKLISTGKNHQISIPPLMLYDTSSKRITRKLWKPDRLDSMIYEKFKDEVNDKNSVYLLDEEITEILVRHRYNVEQALLWCIKSNPEFQYYVKRSSNRKRIITRNWEKILDNY